MRQRGQQSGFGTVELLLVVLLVAVVGLAGVLTYQHRHKVSTVKDTASTSPSQSSSSTMGTPSTQPVATTTQYLTIKEWGVRLPLPDDIKDAYYTPSTGSADVDGTPNTMWIGLKSLDSSGCEAANANKGGKPLASIVRTMPNETDPVSGKPYTQLYSNGVTIGKYYYFYNTWSKGNNCTTASTFTKVDSSFTAAIKNTSTSTTSASN